MIHRLLQFLFSIALLICWALPVNSQVDGQAERYVINQNLLKLSDNPTNTNNSTNRSKIQIQQIGRNNNIRTNTVSRVNQTRMFQVGEENTVFQELVAGQIQNTIVQTGYENSFIHIDNLKSRAHTATVVQYGLRQNLVWLGDNRLSQNMHIRMRGKNQTVIVRNRR